MIIILGICVLIMPFMWLEGRAKADYIKQTQSISIPWHKAVFLQVNASGINATLTHKNYIEMEKISRD